jgi:uncharacterized membrane protein YjgN (DUF898 family)
LKVSLFDTYKEWVLLSVPFLVFYGAVGLLAYIYSVSLYTSLGGKLAFGLVGVVYVVTLFVPVIFKALFAARFQNLIWNNTTAQGIRFVSTLKARSLTWLYIKNLFLIVLTFGLYWPFAFINVVKLRAASISLVTAAPLMLLAAQHAAADKERNAVGDAVGEMFDIDIAL